MLCSLLLLFAGCAGPRETTTDTAEPDEPPIRTETRRPQTVQGFRIQILTTQQKDAADEGIEDALAWWGGLSSAERPAGLGDGELAADTEWQQPYYRVRLGNFATQQEAEQALRLVRERFSDAFLVPALVTVYR